MKTKVLIIGMAVCTIVNAQYTKLLDFNGTNGSGPFGSVVLSAGDSVLYGMTNGGSLSSNINGTIFSIRTDGTNCTTLYGFSAASPDGDYPYGSLIRSGNVLYGMTSGYGQYGWGTIFSINTNGTGFKKIHDFNGTNGGAPNGTLTICGNTLFGMTYGTGGPNKGNVFSIHTDGTSYKDLLDFNDANGSHPGYGALAMSGNKLYGTTMSGGINGGGVLFSVDSDGTGYNKLFDFNNVSGTMPYGTVVVSGNLLYGSVGGGTYGDGVIYSIHTDGTAYKKIFEFNGTNGQGLDNTLALQGSTLFGTTQGGGTSNNGTVFSIDTSGNGFQSLYSFGVSSITGSMPRCQISISGTKLYGTTVGGGTYGGGVVFSFETHPAPVQICMVSVDDSSKYNHIVWQKPIVTNIDSFIVFREITTNNYKRIGAIPYSALSEFIDTVRTKYFPFTGDPNAGTYRYKLQIRDTSGNYSSLSRYHNTLFVSQSGGTFNWNQYTIEGDSIPLPSISSYMLYRDDNSTGAWHVIQGVASSQTTVTDPNYSSYTHGSWRVETSWGITCTPSIKSPEIYSTYSTSRSNVTTSIATGIEQSNLSVGVTMYPNPASGIFKIICSEKTSSIAIMNVLGEKIYSSVQQINNSTIDLSSQPSGIYFLKITSQDGSSAVKEIIKE